MPSVITTIHENQKPPGGNPMALAICSFGENTTRAKEARAICTIYGQSKDNATPTPPLVVPVTIAETKETTSRLHLMSRSTSLQHENWRHGAMRDNNVTELLSVTVRLHGRDAERVIYAAGMACKSPEQYVTDLAIWNGRMAVPEDGAA